MPILSLSHRFLRNDRCIDVGLEVSDHLLHAHSILNNLLLTLLGLDTNLEDFIDDLLKILHHIVVLRLKVLIRLVYDVHEDFTVVLEGTPQRLQVIVNLCTQQERVSTQKNSRGLQYEKYLQVQRTGQLCHREP